MKHQETATVRTHVCCFHKHQRLLAGMPRARPRPEPEPCDCLECREPAGAAPSQGAADAAARQAPPPKCLVLFADGVLPALEAADRAAGQHGAPLLPHLDGLVREGSLGTLAVREAATAASQAEGGAEQLAELAQLLGVQVRETLPLPLKVPLCMSSVRGHPGVHTQPAQRLLRWLTAHAAGLPAGCCAARERNSDRVRGRG